VELRLGAQGRSKVGLNKGVVKVLLEVVVLTNAVGFYMELAEAIGELPPQPRLCDLLAKEPVISEDRRWLEVSRSRTNNALNSLKAG
jgi:hypothetical protein